MEVWFAWLDSKKPWPAAPYMKRYKRVEHRKELERGAESSIVAAEVQAQHGPWRMLNRRSSLTRLRAGSQTLSMASDTRRMKHQRTLAASAAAHCCGRQHCCCCSAMSLGELQTCAMRLIGMSVTVGSSHVSVSYIVATPGIVPK